MKSLILGIIALFAWQTGLAQKVHLIRERSLPGVQIIGESDTLNPTVDPPDAAFAFSPTGSILPGETVTFTNQSTGTVDSILWTFVSGSPATGNGESEEVQWSAAGNYLVKLVVRNEGGADSAFATIKINETPAQGLTANFSVTPYFSTPNNAYPTEPILFEAIVTGDDPPANSYQWFFPEGWSPTYTTSDRPFSSGPAGIWNVLLVVSNGIEIDSVTKQVTIEEPDPDTPEASFTFSPSSGIETGQTVQFFDQSSGPPLEWIWRATGATVTISTAKNPEFTWASAGTYPVELVAINSAGRDSITVNITVEDTPPPGEEVYYGDIFVSSSTGNDSNPGTKLSPKMTLASAYSVANPGDTIALLRGDIWEESLEISKQNVTIIPYPYSGGSNTDFPVISGYTSIPSGSFTSSGNNRFWASVPGSMEGYPNSVLIQGKHYLMGRKPEVDISIDAFPWYRIDAVNGSSNYIDVSEVSTLGLSTDAEIIYWSNGYRYAYADVSGVSGNLVYYTNGFNTRPSWDQAQNDPYANYPVAFSKDQALCDDYGEWAYHESNNRLYVNFGASAKDVQVSIRGKGITLDNIGSLYATIDGIKFIGFNEYAIACTNSNDNTIKNCEFENNEVGIYLNYSSNVSVLDNTFLNSSTAGVTGDYGGQDTDYGAEVVGNTVIGATLHAHMMETGQGGESGIKVNCSDSRIESNLVRRFGYNGISFTGNSMIVDYNTVDSGGLTMSDGAGIYTFEKYGNYPQMSYIRHNTVTNIFGNQNDPTLGNNHHFGIYLDDGTQNVTVEDNLVENIGRAGFYWHNSNNIFANRNTIRNCGEACIFMFNHDDSAPNLIANVLEFYDNTIEFTSNNLYSSGQVAGVFIVHTVGPSINSTWRGDRNNYGIGSGLNLATCCTFGGTVYNLSGLQSLTGDEANSTTYNP
jgi:parallel beta-helix repeat protein